jgi:hypothetical protein
MDENDNVVDLRPQLDAVRNQYTAKMAVSIIELLYKEDCWSTERRLDCLASALVELAAHEGVSGRSLMRCVALHLNAMANGGIECNADPDFGVWLMRDVPRLRDDSLEYWRGD